MKARQNPLSKFEAFMQSLVEGPFAWLFPSRIEPVELMRKLERAMEDNTLLQSEGRRLAPNIYDVYVSIKDHQQLAAGQNVLIRDWQNNLVEYARHRHYLLRAMPVIRLHAESTIRSGQVRIETELGDSDGGVMATQALSPEQLAQLRAQLSSGQQLPGITSAPDTNAPSTGGYSGGLASSPAQPPVAVQLPPAWLTIRSTQGDQQIYRIEKSLVNIGRQLSNDIIVEDKRVSRYHAQIKYQPDGQFVIFDLGSTNRITINNQRSISQHVLRNGDKFTIGSYDFYFERR
ncbi:MAG: DUF3662 and FHA domain-containing protein [Ktedonobacteraceae bacterium]|nr:DUF3662 and FHA domain-containing protein [Ktedonobacteraceae bacterium]MBO0790203.1 DUF3662 and FHA domain-containing protein [Ktedonobacteraceae bacterium]